MARLTLWGMNKVYDLFSDIVLPDGISKDGLLDTIWDMYGQLYPYHQEPPALKESITRWFDVRKEDFSRMYRALTEDYNPIHNYDRHEEHDNTVTDGGQDSRTLQLSGTDTRTSQLSGTDQTTSQASGTDSAHSGEGGEDAVMHTGTTTRKVSAFDSSDFTNREQEVPDLTDVTRYGRTTDGTATYGRKDDQSTTYGRTDTDTTEYGRKDTDTTSYGKTTGDKGLLHAYGNIGVTTSQQMITAELELRAQYDLYMIIASLFEERFLMRIY